VYALHEYQCHNAARPTTINAENSRARSRRMYSNSYICSHRLFAEEAIADIENARVFMTSVSENYHTVLTNIVPTWQTVLWPSTKTAQACTVAVDVAQPTTQLHEIFSMNIGSGFLLIQLLKIAKKMRSYHTKQLTSWNNIRFLSLTHLM
jgi:hypothetical protein